LIMVWKKHLKGGGFAVLLVLSFFVGRHSHSNQGSDIVDRPKLASSSVLTGSATPPLETAGRTKDNVSYGESQSDAALPEDVLEKLSQMAGQDYHSPQQVIEALLARDPEAAISYRTQGEHPQEMLRCSPTVESDGSRESCGLVVGES
jgi:hypothetical protein